MRYCVRRWFWLVQTGVPRQLSCGANHLLRPAAQRPWNSAGFQLRAESLGHFRRARVHRLGPERRACAETKPPGGGVAAGNILCACALLC